MKMYFLPGVTPGQLAGVNNACQMEIDRRLGTVVEEGDLERSLQLLNLRVRSERGTSYEGIYLLEVEPGERREVPPAPALAPETPIGTVKIVSWDGKQKEKFVEIAEEEILPFLGGQNVILSVPHGYAKALPPVGSRDFQVFIWSSPVGSKNKTTPTRMFGFEVDCRDESFPPSGEGTAIVDPETGHAVAEFFPDRAIYIHHDLCHHGTDRELSIFRKILEEVVAEIAIIPEERIARDARRAEERRAHSRASYVSECSKRFERTVSGTKQAVLDGSAEIAELQKRLVRKIREVAGAERKLEQLMATKGGELDKYGQEFDKLLSVPKVKDVVAGDGVIKIFTEVLYCIDPRTRKRHEIGEFRIEIYTNGANNGVHWYNITRRVDGYESGMQAPHVFPSGKACLGNTAEIFPDLIGRYEFSAAAMVAIQFVESVNTDDAAGRHIDKWPVAS